MHISFILIEPATPENIGAAARAIKTMGFNQLRLVNPADHLSGPARWLAHASNDILENAQVFSSFEDATSDIDFIIGTSAKQRSVKEDYVPVKQIPNIIQDKGNTIRNVAVVFGREDTGLRNNELKACDLVTTVPLKTTYPSLNLAQAIMIYAYELSSLNFYEHSVEKNINEEGFKVLKQKTEFILKDLDFNSESAIYPRILERLMFLSEGDIHLLHSITAKYLEKKK